MKARTLFLLGYEDLVPLAGKAPRLKDWVNYRAGLEDVLQWPENQNVGLQTARFPAIDSDVTDPQAAMRIMVAVREVFGVQTPIRVGREPKFLALTRLPDDGTSFRKAKVHLVSPEGIEHHIELLGQGQQFVISGIHPDTGNAYKWTQELVSPDELPEMTEERWNAFVSAVEHKLKLIGWSIGETTTVGNRTTVAAEQLYAPSMEHLQSAMLTIKNHDGVPREVFVQVAHAVKGSTPPEEDEAGLQIFLEWASRGPSGADPAEPTRVWHTIRRDNIGIGWDIVRQLAERSGWNGAPAAVEQAQQEFQAVQEVKPEDEFPLVLADIDDHDLVAREVLNLNPGILTTGDGDWFLWDGNRWAPDPQRSRHAQGRVATALVEIYYEMRAKYEQDDKARRKLIKLTQVDYVSRVFTTIERSGRCYVPRSAVNDAVVHVTDLNTPDGLYDLRSLKAAPTTPSDLVTQCTTVAPDFGAECPTFQKFLLTSCGGDKQLVDYVLAVLGSSLTSDNRERLVWFLTGPSGAGKSTIMKHLHGILGDYSAVCPQGALIHGEHGAHTSAIAGFRDARFIHGSEIDRGQRWNVSLLKSITGNEVITARRLYHAYEEFVVAGKFIIAGNETPTLPTVDSAIQRRLRVIPFEVPDEPDPDLDAKLRDEYPAILALLMQAARRWLQDGYPYSEIVATTTAEYFREEDLIGQFRDQYFLTTGHTDHFVDNATLWALWEGFTTNEQRRDLGIKDTRALTKALCTSDPKRITHDRRRVEGRFTRGLEGMYVREETNVEELL